MIFLREGWKGGFLMIGKMISRGNEQQKAWNMKAHSLNPGQINFFCKRPIGVLM